MLLLYCTDYPACITGITDPSTTRIITNPGLTSLTPSVSRNAAQVTLNVADDILNVTEVLTSAIVVGTDILADRHVIVVNVTHTATNTKEICALHKMSSD